MPYTGNALIPYPHAELAQMARLLFNVNADRRLTALAADPAHERLYNQVNDVLDLIEDDPSDPRVRRRRYQSPPIWGVVVPAADAPRDWLILWSETSRGPLVHYIGEDLV